MDIAALIISGLSFLVAIVGTILANKRASEGNKVAAESHRLALEAKADAERAAQAALWSKSVEAVHHLIGLDPMTDAMGEPLKDLRIANTALLDEVPWPGLAEWLGIEQALGATLFRQSTEERGARGAVGTPEERMESLAPAYDWAVAFINNLRLFRRDGENAASLATLTKHARQITADVHERHGWPLPKGPNIVPLD